MSRFEDLLEVPRVPTISEMEQAFAGPHQMKDSTTAVVVCHSCWSDSVTLANIL